MENQQNAPEEENNPVSRKTNEEIDLDDDGNLIIGGENSDQSKSVPSDGPVSQDLPRGRNSLSTDEDS